MNNQENNGNGKQLTISIPLSTIFVVSTAAVMIAYFNSKRLEVTKF